LLSWLRRHRVAFASSLLLGAGLAYLLHRGALPVVPDRAAFAEVRWPAALAYALLFAISIYVRAHRWAFLLAPIHRVPLRRVIAIALIGQGALVILPFRTGELVRPTLIREEGKLSGWAATGTIAAERVADGLFLGILLLAALALAKPLDPLPDHIGRLPVPVALVPAAAYAALAVFAAAFAVLAAFYVARARAARAIESVIGIVSRGLAQRVSSAAGRLADGLRFLPKPRLAAPFAIATLLSYALNTAAIAILLHGAGFESASLAEAGVIMGVINLGVLVPNAPGYFGAFQVAVYAGLAMFHPPDRVATAGSAVVFVIYAVQIGAVLIAAALGLLMEHVSPRAAVLAGEEALNRGPADR
jgi:glycosyltransferase 2 family protein